MRTLLTAFLISFATFVLSGCTLPFTEKDAGLQVMTEEVPATVFLNGQYVEKAPYVDKDLPAGDYSVRIQPDDPEYIPHETTVSLREGLLTVVMWKPGTRPETSSGVTYEMEPISNKKRAEISIVSIPNRAIASLDGGERSFTPVVQEVTPGEHELRINLPSYETQSHTLNAEAGYRINVDIKLGKTDTKVVEEYVPPPSTSSASATIGIDTDSETATETATPATAAASTATASASPSPATINGPSVSIQSTNFFQNGREVLRVRTSSTSESETLTFVESGTTHPYTGSTEGGWYQIRVDGSNGWVSSEYATLQR